MVAVVTFFSDSFLVDFSPVDAFELALLLLVVGVDELLSSVPAEEVDAAAAAVTGLYLLI